MKHRKAHIFLMMILLAGSSCNTLPELNVSEPDDLIVIDGWIEQGDQARVMLTANSPYFTTIDSASIRDLVLSRAKATLTDGFDTEVLILRKDTNYFPPFYYAGNTLFGDTGRTYAMTVDFGGKTAMVQTTIPPSVPIDALEFKLAEEEDSLGYVEITFTDPADQKNYYRIMTRRKGIDNRYISSFIMAINDQYFSGETIRFSLYRAPESFLASSGSDYYHVNDTVIVKLLTMDEASFRFWYSYQEEVINAANPFASSLVDLESNVAGDGLGVFSGYGVSIDTLYN
jgi:hypothetical protein